MENAKIMERIYGSAIWYKELDLKREVRNPINIDKGIVVIGHRHFDIIKNVYNLLGLRTVQLGENSIGEHEQGFVTNKDRFVDRKEAMLIAKNANQVSQHTEHLELYSEDIY